jgi:phospholipase C
VRRNRFVSNLFSVAAMVLFIAGCKGNSGLGPPGVMPAVSSHEDRAAIGPLANSIDKIKHIVIIIQENRSFNNLFNGYPGATTSSYGYISTGRKVALQPVTLATTWGLEHNASAMERSCNGTGKIPGTHCKMNGFNKETWTCLASGSEACPIKYPPYAYVPRSQIKPYFDLAHQYVLGDQMYESDFDMSSYVSHQYIIAGTNPDSAVNYPQTRWGCPGGKLDLIDRLKKDRKIIIFPKGENPCTNVTTLGDELDKVGVSWAFYAASVSTTSAEEPCGSSNVRSDVSKGRSGIWSAYQAIEHICYGPDWDEDVFSPPTQFLTDVKNGSLRSVAWVTPTYSNSDHGGSGSSTGPSWVASLVNAIGKSRYWNSTAIFIFWDDSGGWYDPEAPAYLDNDSLGFRLPLLIISPYAKQGYVSHVHYEHGSILKFVEDRFGLARLAASDQRATSPEKDCFDFLQAPRKFVKIKAPLDENYFMHQPLDTRPPDSD